MAAPPNPGLLSRLFSRKGGNAGGNAAPPLSTTLANSITNIDAALRAYANSKGVTVNKLTKANYNVVLTGGSNKMPTNRGYKSRMNWLSGGVMELYQRAVGAVVGAATGAQTQTEAAKKVNLAANNIKIGRAHV